MSKELSIDEFEALRQVRAMPKHSKASACVGRNAKKLSGLKYLSYAKDGSLSLTEKGEQALFSKDCIDGLRAVSAEPTTKLESAVALFLGRKSYVTRNEDGSFVITARGLECLADIDRAA
jgi:hypothetical protein